MKNVWCKTQANQLHLFSHTLFGHPSFQLPVVSSGDADEIRQETERDMRWTDSHGTGDKFEKT